MASSRVAPPLVRRVNMSSVFAEFWNSDVLTVSDLMEATGLTRATVHAVCKALVELGWVQSVGARRVASTPAGRPAKHFTFNQRAGYVFGIDIGDTSINAVLADLRGTTMAKRHHAGLASETSPDDRVRHVGKLVRDMLDEAQVAPELVLATGMGLAAPVSADGAQIGFAGRVANPYWESFRLDLATLGADLPTSAILVANDANLAALGEQWRGVATDANSFVALLAGNRLGAGLMDSGRLLHGQSGGAGEMSFLDYVLDDAGADGIAPLTRRWAAQAIDARPDSLLATASNHDHENITPEMVFAAAAAGDQAAADVLERLADRFARLIAIVSIFLNPELVVIGGAVAEAAAVLVGPITQRLQTLMPVPAPRVACSTFGDAIVTVGAVRLALNHVQAHALDGFWDS